MSDERTETPGARPDVRTEHSKKSHSIPIDVVFLDFHGTMVIPRWKMTRAELVKKIAEEVLGTTIDESAESIARRTRRFRIKLTRELKRREQNGPSYWKRVNPVIFERWGCTLEQAEEISRRVSSGVDYYRMSRARLEFFQWLFAWLTGHMDPSRTRKYYVVTATNAGFDAVRSTLERYGISDRIKVITGDQLGAYKPSKEFYQKLLAETGATPERTLMIGNSPFNDLSAAKLGIHVLWIRDRGETVSIAEAREFLGEARGSVFVASGLKSAKRVLRRHFASVR